MEQWLQVWDRGAGFQRVRAKWTAQAGPAGELLAVTTDSGKVEGTFCDIDADGALLLKLTSGDIRRYTAGDVALGGEGSE